VKRAAQGRQASEGADPPLGAPNGAPVLINPMISGGQLKFSFAAGEGRNYAGQYTDSLRPVDWHPLTNLIGTGGAVTLCARS